MAYSATPDFAVEMIGGRTHRTVTIVELEVTAAQEFTFKLPTKMGTLIYHKSIMTLAGAGQTATEVDPRVGEVAAGVEMLDNGAAGATTRNLPNARYNTINNTIYADSRCDGNIGATGDITTVMVFVDGFI